MMTRYGNPSASVVLIQMADDHDLAGIETEFAEIQKRTDTDFCLTVIRVHRWNTDLSPWNAPAVFGQEAFGNGACETLTEVLKCCTDRDRAYVIGGYSLAGLFALWAAFRTEVFTGVAAASPSVWFPGFMEYMKENRCYAGSVYLSLGDREEKTRNPVLSAVGDRIRETYDILKKQGISTILEWNQGNHFRDAETRTAKAFAWVLSDLRTRKNTRPTGNLTS